MNLNSWPVRAGIVVGLTWAAVRYLPQGPIRAAALSIGAVSAALIVAGNVPMVNNVLSGNLLPTTSTPTT